MFRYCSLVTAREQKPSQPAVAVTKRRLPDPDRPLRGNTSLTRSASGSCETPAIEPDANSTVDWMTAHAALQLVCERNGLTLATNSIRNRAGAGLLRSWARLLRKDDRRRDIIAVTNAELPREFWQGQSKGGDWAAGDFETLVSDRRGYSFERMQAFGVMFDRAGIEAMLASAANAVAPAPQAIERNRVGRPSAEWWPAFAEELAVYIHECGLPDGDDAQGQSIVIDAVFGRLSERGKTEPGRTTIQPVVSAVIRRIRSTGN